MIYPILYETNETDFFSLGLGPIKTATEAFVTEERNGSFILEGKVIVDDEVYPLLQENRIIKADASPALTDQRFRIKRIVPNHEGQAEIYAEHVSYLSQELPMKPEVFVNGNGNSALLIWKSAILDDNPFFVDSDITTDSKTNWRIDKVENPRQALGGVEGSILDVWGGEYRFDNYHISLLKKRGTTANTILAYGRNITDFEQERNIMTTYTTVYPFAIYTDDKEEERIVTIDGYVVDCDNITDYPNRNVLPVDFSNEFEHDEVPTKAKLKQLAQDYIKNNDIGIPKTSIKVSFLDLAQTADYADIATLETVELCDDVRVHYEKLGVDTIAKVIRTKWNVLRGAYEEIEIGEKRTTLSSIINDTQTSIKEIENQTGSAIIAANGKNMIFHGLFGENGEGEPTAIRVGDMWYKPNGEDTEFYIWDGTVWAFIMSTAKFDEIDKKIEEAMQAGKDAEAAAEEAKNAADDAKAVGEEAKQAGEAAQLAANETKNAAADAKQVGEEAQKVGAEAKAAAEDAKSAAADAKAVGENAQQAANDAKQAGENAAILAGQAQETADDVNQRIGDVVIDIGDIQGDVNTIVADVGNVQTDIGKIITDATATTNKANDAFNKASAVEGRTSTLETSVGSIKSTMTDIEMDLDSTTKKINEVSTTVDGQKSEIASVKTTANSALSKANTVETTVDGVKSTLTSVQTDIAGISQGSRNLLKNSSFIDGVRSWNVATALNAKVVDDYLLVNKADVSTGRAMFNQSADLLEKLKINTNYSLGFAYYIEEITAAGTLGDSNVFLRTRYVNSSVFFDIPIANIEFDKIGEWRWAMANGVTQSNRGEISEAAFIIALNAGTIAKIRFKTFILVEGSNITDWYPNPDELATVTKVNELTTTVDGNTSKIASVETTATSALSKANIAQSTADGNTTKITAAQTTANSALTKANTVEQTVDGQKTTITSIQTNLDNNITKVNQITETVDGHTQIIASTTTTANSALTKANSVSSTVDGLTVKISSVETTANAANTKALQVEATASGLTTTVQNISNSGSNMVTNGGFENDFIGWNPGTRHSIDSAESHTGSKSLKISSGSGTTIISPVVNTFAVIPGRKYEVSFWHKTSADANGNSDNQKLRLANSSGSLLHAIAWTGAQTEWAIKSAIFTAGSNIYEWQFSLTANHTTGTVWWDDISIVDVTDRESASTQFTQLATDINLKVSKGDVINQINVGTESILIAGNKLNITAQTTIDNAVIKTANIVDLAVSTAKISDLAVSEGKIGNLAVTNAKIANLSVTEGKIGDAAITNAKIGNLAVSEGKIANLAVTNAKIASLAVTEGKIGDAAITTAKIGNLAVSEGKIADLAVSSAKIANLAVTETKIGDAAITNAKIGDLAVSTAKIADAAITDAKIGNLSATKITAGTLNAANVNIVNLNANSISTGELTGINIRAATFYGSSGSGNMQLNGVDLRFDTSSNSFRLNYNGIVNVNTSYGTRALAFFNEGINIAASSSNSGNFRNSGLTLSGDSTYVDFYSIGSTSANGRLLYSGNSMTLNNFITGKRISLANNFDLYVSSLNVHKTNDSDWSGVYAASFTNSSERRLKTNLVLLKDSLSVLQKMKFYEYDRIDTLQHQLGPVLDEAPEKIIQGQGIDQYSFITLVATSLQEHAKKTSQDIDMLALKIDNLQNEFNQLRNAS